MALSEDETRRLFDRLSAHGAAWQTLATQTGVGGARTGNNGQGWGGFGSIAMACWASVTCWLAAAAAEAADAEAVE
jgi:hypothetical protein